MKTSPRVTVLALFYESVSKIGFLNPKESENRFFDSFVNRLIQDFSREISMKDHSASKEPKNSLPERKKNPRLIWAIREILTK